MKKMLRFLLIALGSLVACGIIATLLPKSEETPAPTIVVQAPSATVPATRTAFPTVTIRATWTVTDTPAPIGTLSPTTATRSGGLVLPTSSPAKIAIDRACSQPDPAGDDNQVLTEEYICLVNRGDAPVELKGWKVHDEGRNSEYTFRALTLAPGATVKLRTGKGENGPADVYWGKGQAVWNNGGDTVYLYDPSGAMIDQWGN